MRISISVFLISTFVAITFMVIGLMTANTAAAQGAPSVTLGFSPTNNSFSIARDHTIGKINLRKGGNERYFDLIWETKNVTSCESEGFDYTKARKGSKLPRNRLTWNQINQPTGTTKTYTMNCTGPGGTASDDITLTVSDEYPFVVLEWVVFRPAPYGKTSEHWSSWGRR